MYKYLLAFLLIALPVFAGISYTSPTSNKSFFVEVEKGNVPGHRVVHILAHNPVVSTTMQDIWHVGGTKTQLQSAVTLEAISSDADDDAAGTGAQIITLNCLDSSWNEISQDLTMNGLTVTAATGTACIRFQSAEVKEVGTYGGSNVGIITIRVSSAGATLGAIGIDMAAPNGRTFGSHFTIPGGKTGFVLGYEIVVEANKNASVNFAKLEAVDDVTTPFSPVIKLSIDDGINGPNGHHPVSIQPGLPEKTDIWFRAILPSGTGGVTVNYEVLLIDN